MKDFRQESIGAWAGRIDNFADYYIQSETKHNLGDAMILPGDLFASCKRRQYPVLFVRFPTPVILRARIL